MIYMEENGSGESPKNVLGSDLEDCSNDPLTGYLRDGKCREVPGDKGRHQICSEMTREFLEYSKSRGNDLITPSPEMNFPGLQPGDRWCVCVPRWVQALDEGKAPPVYLPATSQAVLDEVPLEVLREHAVE